MKHKRTWIDSSLKKGGIEVLEDSPAVLERATTILLFADYGVGWQRFGRARFFLQSQLHRQLYRQLHSHD